MENFSSPTVLAPSVGLSTGWTLLALGLLQLRDAGTADRNQQKLRILTMTVSWISACMVWRKRDW